MKPNYVFSTVLLLLMWLCPWAQSRDTVQLTLPQAEGLFLQNNLSVLAAQYGLDAAQALVQQARLWDNPVLNTDQNLLDKYGRFMNHSKSGIDGTSGQVYVQVQQLLRIGGKIAKQTALASTNARINQLQLQGLLRNLRYSLRTDFYQVAQLDASLRLDNDELVQVNKLLKGMQAQLAAGNISQKEYLRIQALQLSLLQDIANYQRNLSDVQAELHTLLPSEANAYIRPVVEAPKSVQNLPTLDSLIATAKQNNPDYLIEQTSLTYQEQNLRYQRALRLPDLNAGIEYDKASSYVPNYVGLTLSLPLPVFNRNQGNIAAAGFAIKQQQATVGAAEQRLAADVQNAWQQWHISQQMQANVDSSFSPKYTTLLQNAINAYEQKQLGLLEFIDVFEAYKSTQLQLLQQQYNIQKATEDLNRVTGTNLF
jgi:outer membrane protein, heavy metal efflux system